MWYSANIALLCLMPDDLVSIVRSVLEFLLTDEHTCCDFSQLIYGLIDKS